MGSPEKKGRSKKSIRTNTIVVFVAIGVVCVSVLLTLLFSGRLIEFGSGSERGYKNVTFTDAQITCEKQTREDFGSELKSVTPDDHSSRFDSRSMLFKIFLDVETTVKKERVEFYISCYVDAGSGRVKKYEAFENKEAPEGRVIKRNSDKLIEWNP